MSTQAKICISAALLAALCAQSAPLPDREARLTEDRGECTTAVIAGSATANGRPMLWKNRDVSFPDQEVMYFEDGFYPYVALITAGETADAWGGVNSTGFAIEDASNLNTPDTVSGPDDDGRIIKLALQTCRTVAEFQSILDSTSVVGHTRPAVFGVIDAEGGGSVFETFMFSYVRYDATDSAAAPLGILVRANYSYAGSPNGRIGIWRHDRAMALLTAASLSHTLNPLYVCRTVARDLRTSNIFDPYPLPYEGQQGGLPWGWISTSGAICRRITVSAVVIEGVLPNENPLLSTMWTFPMAVQYGVALPFWVSPRTTPPEVNGDSTAPLSDEGLRIKTIAQHAPGFHDTLDTYILVDSHGGGVHATTFPLEDLIFARTDSALAIWRALNSPDSAGMTALTAQLARMAYDTLRLWPGPGDLWVAPRPVTTLTLYYTPEQGLMLRWLPVTEDSLGLPITPSGYSIWRFSPFWDRPDSVSFTDSTCWQVTDPPDSAQGFFEVRAIR